VHEFKEGIVEESRLTSNDSTVQGLYLKV